MEMRENAGTSKNKILIFGGTGYIGRHLVRASVSMGHPTYVYSRPVTPRTPSATVDIRSKFISVGVTVIQGELEEHEKMVSAMKHVDIVISALALPQVPDQLKIINAIIAAKNIRRFLPSEFGCEEDRIIPLQPFQSVLDKKRQIRRAIEASHIPFTFVSANCCSSYFINVLLHPHDNCSDKIIVYGTGEAKAVLNYEEDIAKYTIKVANDPRACNRIVIYRPPANVISQNELISLWEKKTGRSYEKVHMPEEDIVRLSQTLPNPQNIPISIIHSVFVKGDLMTYELKEDDLEVSSLYPEVDYVTIDKLLDIFLTDPPQPATAAFG